MRILDPGHHYDLTVFDGEGVQAIRFMKREGPGYPFNAGHYSGTNCQEVLRALIDRVKYLDAQVAASENQIILAGLRSALFAFELRAARRHGRDLGALPLAIELVPVCDSCGHIGCDQHREAA